MKNSLRPISQFKRLSFVRRHRIALLGIFLLLTICSMLGYYCYFFIVKVVQQEKAEQIVESYLREEAASSGVEIGQIIIYSGESILSPREKEEGIEASLYVMIDFAFRCPEDQRWRSGGADGFFWVVDGALKQNGEIFFYLYDDPYGLPVSGLPDCR